MVASKLTPEERVIKKRQAARLRQQRCRQRKRERAAAASALAMHGSVPQVSIGSVGLGGLHRGIAIAPAGPSPYGQHAHAAPAPRMRAHAHAHPPSGPGPYSQAQARAAPGPLRTAHDQTQTRQAPPLPAAVSASSSRSFDGTFDAAAHARAAYHAAIGGAEAPAAPVSPSPPTESGSGGGGDIRYVKGKHGPGSVTLATPGRARAASALASISSARQVSFPPSAPQSRPPQQGEGQRLSPQQAAEEKEAVDAILALTGRSPNATPPMPPLKAGDAAVAAPPLQGPPPPPGTYAPPGAAAHPRAYGAPHEARVAYPEGEVYSHATRGHHGGPYSAAQAHGGPPAGAEPPAAPDDERDFLQREDRLRDEMLALRQAEARLAQQQHELERRRYRHQMEARQRAAQQAHLDRRHAHQVQAQAHMERAFEARGEGPVIVASQQQAAVMGRGRVMQRPAQDGFYYAARRPAAPHV